MGVRLEADTAVNLFICCAQAMFDLIHPASLAHKSSVAATDEAEWHQITLSAADPESLLVDWLSKLLYLYETTGIVYHRYHVNDWERTFIEATVTGHKPDQPPDRHIKAVTYHQLDVAQTPDNWQARVFFDI
jgi:SHS2 domain-containing protein